jgi:Rieske Fe-S protein
MSQDFDRRRFICTGCAAATLVACGGGTDGSVDPLDTDTDRPILDTGPFTIPPTGGDPCEVVPVPNGDGWRGYDIAALFPELFDVGSWAGRPHPDDGRLLIIAHVQQDCYVVMERACTHQNVLIEYDADRGQFKCPRHASLYNWEGHVVGGPAPNALETFPAGEVDGTLWVYYG